MNSVINMSAAPMPWMRSESARHTLKALMWSVLLLAFTFAMMSTAFAGPTGGATGSAAATQTRILGVVTGWQLILFAIGAFIVSGAFMYVGYGLMFGGKQLKDMTNVVFGAMIAGMGPMLAAWFFS